MSKVSDMKLKDILKITNIILEKNDIVYFCNNDEVIKKFTKLYWNPNKKSSDIMNFLVDNEKYIDKEALVLLIARNYEESLKIIDYKIEYVTEKLNYNNSPEALKMLIKLEKERKIQTDIVRAIKGIGKSMKKIIPLYCYNEEQNRYCIDIIDSRKVFQGKDVNKNLKRLNEIDKSFKKKSDNHENGIEFLLLPLESEDVYKTFVDEDLIQMILVMIKENEILEKGIKTNNELVTLKHNNREQYLKFLNSIDNDNYIDDIKNALKEFSAYLDIDKLLLISAYRYNELLDEEKDDMDSEYYGSAKEILTEIRKHIGNDKVEISCELKHRVKNEYVKRQVNYSVEDLEDCIERFIGDTYISKKDINYKREKLLTDEIKINSIDSQVLDLMKLSKEEINTIMDYNLENFIYGVKKFNYNINQILSKLSKNENIPVNEAIKSLYEENIISISSIIDLYARGIISRKFFEEFSEEINISSEINIQKINEQYIEMKSTKKLTEKDKNHLEAMIDIYRIINIEDKSQEEKEEISNEIMYEIAENFNDENDILFYYNKGLLTLNTVADWSGDELIEKLYNESKIKLEEIEKLYITGKVTQKFIEKIVLETNTSYSMLISYMNKGYIGEEQIINMYMNGKIFDIHFEQLAKNGKISISSFKEAKWNRTQNKLEETASIKIEPTLVNIPDKKIKINLVDDDSKNHGYGINSRRKTLIDPNARYELLELLGAKRANAIIPDEENAFYNYEFFVIPNKEGKLDINSVVIAERFYKDKEQKDEFSVDNATYFFQYKDLMVNSNLKKKEMTEQRDNVIFTANHRAGSWAVSVLYKIAQTMASSNFNEYKKGDERAGRVIDELLKTYSQEKLKDILDMTGKIDDTNEFIYEEVNSTYGKSNKNTDDIEL